MQNLWYVWRFSAVSTHSHRLCVSNNHLGETLCYMLSNILYIVEAAIGISMLTASHRHSSITNPTNPRLWRRSVSKWCHAPAVSQIYYHGEPISINVHVTNNTNKTVKKMKISGMSEHLSFLCANSWLSSWCMVFLGQCDSMQISACSAPLSTNVRWPPRSPSEFLRSVLSYGTLMSSNNHMFCLCQWRRRSQFNVLQSFHTHAVSCQQPWETRSCSGWKTEARGHQPGVQHAVSLNAPWRGLNTHFTCVDFRVISRDITLYETERLW